MLARRRQGLWWRLLCDLWSQTRLSREPVPTNRAPGTRFRLAVRSDIEDESSRKGRRPRGIGPWGTQKGRSPRRAGRQGVRRKPENKTYLPYILVLRSIHWLPFCLFCDRPPCFPVCGPGRMVTSKPRIASKYAGLRLGTHRVFSNLYTNIALLLRRTVGKSLILREAPARRPICAKLQKKFRERPRRSPIGRLIPRQPFHPCFYLLIMIRLNNDPAFLIEDGERN